MDPVTAVLYSGGLDSAVLVAEAARDGAVQPLYVSVGLAWERDERAAAAAVLEEMGDQRIRPLIPLRFEMIDIYPPGHWAIRGAAPAFDSPDEEVYLEGRNVVLIGKAAVWMARHGSHRLLLGPLAGNPFPDATPAFFSAFASALSIGLAHPITIDAPFLTLHKADLVLRGVDLGVPLARTLSCMQPAAGRHCGECSKCRERRDAFLAAGIEDGTEYVVAPKR